MLNANLSQSLPIHVQILKTMDFIVRLPLSHRFTVGVFIDSIAKDQIHIYFKSK